MNKSKNDASPIMVVNRPIGIALLTVVLLAIGWVIGHKMAVKAPTEALRSKIEREFERKFERKFSTDKFSMLARGTVAQTNGLIRKIKTQPKGNLKEICDEQICSNIYALSYLHSNERFEETSIGYDFWISLDLLEISSIEEFQQRFNSSKVYDACRDYFVEREDGREHYSNLLQLVSKALSDADKYREQDAMIKKRVDSYRNSGE